MKLLNFQNSLALQLDLLRIAALRFLMKNQLLRKIYSDRPARLGFNFLLLSGLYLLLSLKWSIVLLILGPMVMGYPHLVASYRFLQKPNIRFGLRFNTAQVFRFFIFLTAASLCLRFVGSQFSIIPQLPYGSWELLLSIAALGLFKIKINSFRNVFVVLMTLLIVSLVLNAAWNFPIAFVGFALIFHNWIAFGHWYLAAKDDKNKIVVLFATILFALVHIFIFTGFFDAWISFTKISFLSSTSFAASGWTLASWSKDPLIWDRMIVIYTFGLSMHYYVWMRAIPQSLDQKAVPNSFRRSLEQLRKDCGEYTSVVLFVFALVALGVWLFTSVAGPIYFGLAMLHGWLEFTFLIVASLTVLFKITPELPKKY